MSRLKAIKFTRAVAGDPAWPAPLLAGVRALVPLGGKLAGYASKGIRALGSALGFGGKKGAALATAGITAISARQALKRAGTSAARTAIPAGLGGIAGYALGAGEQKEKKRRRRGLSACEIRGFYRVMRLVRRAGYRPKAPRRRV